AAHGLRSCPGLFLLAARCSRTDRADDGQGAVATSCGTGAAYRGFHATGGATRPSLLHRRVPRAHRRSHGNQGRARTMMYLVIGFSNLAIGLAYAGLGALSAWE